MAEMFRDHYEAASSMQIKVQLGGFGQPANANFRFAQELKAAPPPFYADAKIAVVSLAPRGPKDSISRRQLEVSCEVNECVLDQEP